MVPTDMLYVQRIVTGLGSTLTLFLFLVPVCRLSCFLAGMELSQAVSTVFGLSMHSGLRPESRPD